MSMSRSEQLKLAQKLLIYEMTCWIIYFVQAGKDGPIKIGKTKDLTLRMSALQVYNHQPLELLTFVVAPGELEQQLHAYLNEYCIRGEWFEAKGEVLEICDLIRNADLGAVLDRFETRSGY